MKIIKRIILYLLALEIMYFGVLDQKYPLIIFGDLLIFGFLLFIWVLLPLLKSNKLISVLKSVKYFKDFRLLKLLLFTFLIVTSFLNIDVVTYDHSQLILFFFLKIFVAIFMELLLTFRFLINDIAFPSD